MLRERFLVITRIVFASALGMLLLTGCSAGRRIYVTATPSATPQPPPAYTKLPIQIRLDCVREPAARAYTIVWNLPGVPPVLDATYIDNPQESSGPPKGLTGGKVVSLAPCTIVTASKLAWSQYNNIFYLYIEHGSVRGWIMDYQIEVI
jgi:hypothetical protein